MNLDNKQEELEKQMNNSPQNNTNNEQPSIENQSHDNNTVSVSNASDNVHNSNQAIIAPVRTMLQMNIQRLGIITSNLTYVGLASILLILLSAIILPFAYVANIFIVVVISIFTLGLIFLEMSFSDLMLIKTNDLSKFGEVISKAFPFIIGITLIASIVSLVCLVVNKKSTNIGRIILSSIITLLALIVFILLLFGLVEVQLG